MSYYRGVSIKTPVFWSISIRVGGARIDANPAESFLVAHL
jgi:hypothetical protein